MTFLIQQGPLALFAAFLVVHALADYPLQGDYLARNKVRAHTKDKGEWLIALLAHSTIHAGGVWLVSGSLALGATEWILHALIDLGKGEGKFGLVTDQVLHLICKLGYVTVLYLGLVG
ncbi:MAG: DUF3307 domain-containing protein [Akkermansiaceae bacterium]|nr:DUF3307 domain-containing protein [Akkermansiaceae bacterium]